MPSDTYLVQILLPLCDNEGRRFGRAEFYGWSEDKARQYANPERADFGAYAKRRGFRLE